MTMTIIISMSVKPLNLLGKLDMMVLWKGKMGIPSWMGLGKGKIKLF